MQYKPENVDTDKALAYIETCRTEDARREDKQIESIKKYHEGVRDGLDKAEDIFRSALCEKKAVPASYDECVGGAIRKMAQELDIACSDIVESGKGGDEMCSAFAERIRRWCEMGEKVDNLAEVVHG